MSDVDRLLHLVCAGDALIAHPSERGHRPAGPETGWLAAGLLLAGEDEVRFSSDAPDASDEDEATGVEALVILIVDDDPGVHDATVLALHGARVGNRALEFRHAYSAAEARQLIAADTRISLLLLDVVMETSDAGLQLVSEIRNELAPRRLRIVLRTGQPGRAPEEDVRSRFAVDAYLTKAKLTRALLLEALNQVIATDPDAGPAPSH